MYIPNADRVTDLAKLHRFILENDFATVLSVADGRICVTRVPLILDHARGPNGSLIGHAARANPQWRSFDGEAEAMAVFDGLMRTSRRIGTSARLRFQRGITPPSTHTDGLAS